MLGQISGLDSPARSLDRLAAAAERAASMMEQVEAEGGVDRVLATLERLDHAVTVLERIDASLEAARRDGRTIRTSLSEIEKRIVDLDARIAPLIERTPTTGGRRPSKTPGHPPAR
jgi:hypothetical protein